MTDKWDLVSGLGKEDEARLRFALKCISPDDAKYMKVTQEFVDELSADAEWRACVLVQKKILRTMVEFGLADLENLDELYKIEEEIDTLNITLLENHKDIKHDQLAVITEIGRYVSEETKSLLHPGTTSYCILDTARAYLFKRAWKRLREEVAISIENLCELAAKFIEMDLEMMAELGTMLYLQVGRTHLQNTSPVPFGVTLAGYAARLARRLERCDQFADGLYGKVAGIVGTGASISIIVGGEDKALEFEEKALAKLGLKPDYTATQITQKEQLADFGHGLVTLMHVLGDFAEDIRMLYSSAIQEVTSRDNEERLGGSSADAAKNNPIDYENISGKTAVVESGMRILYEMIKSNFQRDLRNSVQARYQPQQMIVEVYESFVRLNKALSQLSVNEDKMAENLVPVRNNPSEAMVAILKSERFIHSEYGLAHDFVKEMSKKVKQVKKSLLEVCLGDKEFIVVYKNMDLGKRDILHGRLEKYIGPSFKKAEINISYARNIIK